MAEKRTITVGLLMEHLKSHSPDHELIFGDNQLTFYRLKQRGDTLVQMEFNELITEVQDLSE